MMIETEQPEIGVELLCYHCGQPCPDEHFSIEEKKFCCVGCKTVFEVLNENDLCAYYDLDKNPGNNIRPVDAEVYAYLDDTAIRKKIIEFDSQTFARVTFLLPSIHCSSCIWLLSNLGRLQHGILKSEVSFTRKTVTIDYNPEKVKLSQLATLTASVGYPPQINIAGDNKNLNSRNSSLIAKLAVAGFCFGNIMLFSFPEYLGLDGTDHTIQQVFSYLNLLLAVPVLLFSGNVYLVNAWKSFSQRQINIDVPIAAGLLALFFRSAYDILSHTGPGYLDSFAGLVFFLLIGRWFQSKTYEQLSFDRDYKSYFPLAVYRLSDEGWKPVIIYDIKKHDRLRIRNMEVIPADAELRSPEAYIDYSFVTGESKPVAAKLGDLIYAGGRLLGAPVEVEVVKETSQSYLTGLWNNNSFTKPQESKYKKIIDRAATKFTWIVMGLAAVTGVVWYFYDPSRMWLVLTAVLMVACPCALALVAPFTYGSMMRVFGRHGFYLKNADVIERMAAINSIVFDKNGTVTSGNESIRFVGDMEDEELGCVQALASCSTHPLSQQISRSIDERSSLLITQFSEKPGKGIEGVMGNQQYRIGSASYVNYDGHLYGQSSFVFVSIDDQVRGYFKIESALRLEVKDLVGRLGKKVKALLSGDNNSDEARMKKLFPEETILKFNQSPQDKLDFVCNQQWNGYRVMMIGDGLNDSGALRQSDVGIAVTEDAGLFSPACDAIITGSRLADLDRFLSLSKSTTRILKTGFALSFFYNFIALSIAMAGYLTPLVAAILMPISSISVVAFSTLAVNYAAKRYQLTIPS